MPHTRPQPACVMTPDNYALSMFSAYPVDVFGMVFPTAYHALVFASLNQAPGAVKAAVITSRSVDDVAKTASRFCQHLRSDWDVVKAMAAREICAAKLAQHPAVASCLLATGDAPIVDNSWRDDYWGRHEDRGSNTLGAIWAVLREACHDTDASDIGSAAPVGFPDASLLTTLDSYVTAATRRLHEFGEDWRRRSASAPVEDAILLEQTAEAWDDSYAEFVTKK